MALKDWKKSKEDETVFFEKGFLIITIAESVEGNWEVLIEDMQQTIRRIKNITKMEALTYAKAFMRTH